MEISRRRFVGFLGALSVFGFKPAAAVAAARTADAERISDELNTSSKKTLLNRFSIAGFQYYDGPGIISRIKSGDELELRAEPENPYDEFAVEIYLKGAKLGYIPRSDNRHISRMLSSGIPLSAIVEHTRPDESPWQAVKAAVYLH